MIGQFSTERSLKLSWCPARLAGPVESKIIPDSNRQGLAAKFIWSSWVLPDGTLLQTQLQAKNDEALAAGRYILERKKIHSLAGGSHDRDTGNKL